jgi:hypothetical protein
MHPVLVDYPLARIVGVWRDLLGTECTSQVHFPYPRPSSTQVYREVFGDARLCFGADTMAIWFTSELLDCPLPGRDLQLWAILMQQAEQLLAQLTGTRN